MISRQTWDETWLEVARVMSRRSRCSRAQVGAVIVDSVNRIIATGYNGPPAGWAPGLDGFTAQGESDCSYWCKRGDLGPTPVTVTSYTDCVTSHAEMNALMFVDRRFAEGGTIYVTGHVCWTCAKAIANSGLARVVVMDDDERSHRSPEESYGLLRSCHLEVDVR